MKVTVHEPSNMKSPPLALADMLERTKWADEFSRQQIVHMAEYMAAVRAPCGTVIFREGDGDHSMGIITGGHIRIVKQDHGNHEQVLARLGPGSTFGEMSLIDGEPRSARAIAENEVELLMMSKEAFTRLCESRPGLGIKLLLKMARLISQRLRKTSGKLVEHLGDGL